MPAFRLPRNAQNWFSGPSGSLGTLARRAAGPVAAVGGVGALAAYGNMPPAGTPPAAPPATAPAATPAPFRPLHPGHSQPSSTTPPPPGVGDKIKGFLSEYWPHMAAGGAGAAGLYGLYQLLNRNDDEEKQASFADRAVAAPAEILQKHPLVAGFLVKCAEHSFDDQQILAAVAIAAERSQAFKSACISAGLLPGKGASRAIALEACFRQTGR